MLDSQQPNCSFNHTSKDDLGKKLPDICCDPASFPDGALTTLGEDNRTKLEGGFPNASDANAKWTCYPRARAAQPGVVGGTTYVRAYFGCEGGNILSGESCTGGFPMYEGKLLYPLPKEVAIDYYVMGTSATDSCSCPDKYGPGPGCYAATSSRMLGIDSPIANLVKLSGTCPPPAPTPAPTAASHFSLV